MAQSTPERESLVTIELKPDGDGTSLTLTHEQFFDEAARDRHQGGWTPFSIVWRRNCRFFDQQPRPHVPEK